MKIKNIHISCNYGWIDLKKPILASLFVIFIFTDCRKVVPSDKLVSESYIHTFYSPGDQFGWYVKPTVDQGCIIVGTESEINSLIILKINDKGTMVRKDTVKGIAFYNPVFTNLDDGGILIYSGAGNDNICKLDQNGAVVFTGYMGGTKKVYGDLSIMKNGSFAIPSTIGWASGNYSRISFVKPDGTSTGEVQIQDVSFGSKFKTLGISLLRCDTVGTYYFDGICFPEWKNTFRDRPKLFIARQQYSGNTLISNKTIIIDSANSNYSANLLYQVTTSDKHTVIAATFGDINFLNKGRIIKLDEDLNIIWKRDLLIGLATACLHIIECPDGNYLISGVCFVDDKSVNQPFACKMDRNGNILWQKIFSTKLYGQFSWCAQATDESYYLSGNTGGFGQGAGLSDLFLFKTDRNGNLK